MKHWIDFISGYHGALSKCPIHPIQAVMNGTKVEAAGIFCPFNEDLIKDEAGVTDPCLPLLTPLVQVLQSEGSYALVEKLWSDFVLTAGNINGEVAWNRDEVLVTSVQFPEWVRIISSCSLLF